MVSCIGLPKHFTQEWAHSTPDSAFVCVIRSDGSWTGLTFSLLRVLQGKETSGTSTNELRSGLCAALHSQRSADARWKSALSTLVHAAMA